MQPDYLYRDPVYHRFELCQRGECAVAHRAEILGDTAGRYAKAGRQSGSSMMSDFDRNAATLRPGGGRASSAVIDQGLRSYMLHVYNYMMLGLAITGFAALGVYMLSVTDRRLARRQGRARRRGSAGADSRRHVPHSDRLHAVREPAEMGGDAVAAGAGLRDQLRGASGCGRPPRNCCSGCSRR